MLNCPNARACLAQPTLNAVLFSPITKRVALKKPEVEKEVGTPKRFYTFCAGAIISKTKVLTVAECFVNHLFSTNNSSVCHECYAVAGTIRNVGYLPTAVNSSEQWRKILNVKLPPICNFDTNDIALVYVDVPFHYNRLVKKIKFGPQPPDFKGYCNISGYSKSSHDIYSDSLMVTNLLLIPNSQCQNIYEKDTSKFICAVIDDSYTANDLLQSMVNSGSPLVCTDTSHTDDGSPVLVGLLTKTSTINDWSFLFTRLSAYGKFIRGRRSGHQLMQLTSDEKNCQKWMINRQEKFLWRAENKSLDQLLEAIKAGVNESELLGYGGAQERKDVFRIYHEEESGNNTEGQSGNKTEGQSGNYTGGESGNYTGGESGNTSIGVYNSESEIDENVEVREEDIDSDFYSDDTDTNMKDKTTTTTTTPKPKGNDTGIEDENQNKNTKFKEKTGEAGGNHTVGGDKNNTPEEGGNTGETGRNYTREGGENDTAEKGGNNTVGRSGNYPNDTDSVMVTADKKPKTQQATHKKLTIYLICFCFILLKLL